MDVIAHFMRHEKVSVSLLAELYVRNQDKNVVRSKKSPLGCTQGPSILRRAANLIRDPDLTAEGLSNCKIFSKNFSDGERDTHVWCSPMTRTIHTAILSFESAIARGVKVQALNALQNWGSSPNGIGMDK